VALLGLLIHIEVGRYRLGLVLEEYSRLLASLHRSLEGCHISNLHGVKSECGGCGVKRGFQVSGRGELVELAKSVQLTDEKSGSVA